MINSDTWSPSAFDPIVLGKYELANRIVMAPMSRSRAYGPEACPGPSTALYYRQRASAGLIITEAIFEYPGMGRYFVDALFRGDYQQILPWMMIAVFFVIIFNLVADILYAVLDPRIRYA